MAASIILDVDGVLLDWYADFLSWMHRQGHVVAGHYPTRYDMRDELPALSTAQVDDAVAAFNVSESFGNLLPHEGALDGVAALRTLFPSAPVVILSASGQEQEVFDLRRRNLEEFAPDEMILVPRKGSKKSILQNLPSGSVMIEDSWHHAEDAIDAGHRSVVIRRPWNENDRFGRRAPLAESWPHAVEMIRKMYNDRDLAA